MKEDKVILINLNHELIICTREEAERIQAKQMAEIFDHAFTNNYGNSEVKPNEQGKGNGAAEELP